ncbi:MAG: beta strand repeat-containing protein [Chthoniobacterales bacterium]
MKTTALLRKPLLLLFFLASMVTVPMRLPAATYTVTNTSDSGNGSLRQAIINSNANAGQDAIHFNISGSGQKVINLQSALPTIADPVFIFGTTQPGYNNTPLIVLNGSSAGASANGLRITAGDTLVVALAITAFGDDGIELTLKGNNNVFDNVITSNGGYGVHVNAASNNTIAGGFGLLAAGTGIQVISGNASGGVLIERNVRFGRFGEPGTGNVLTRNYIGLFTSGTAAFSNAGDGVLIKTASNRIGATSTASRNFISGNAGCGVRMDGTAAADNLVIGNYIGTAANGASAIGNGSSGVCINAGPNNTVGGTATGAGNLISGNVLSGVQIDPPSSGNFVQGNYIGIAASGATAIANSADGVFINDSPNNTIGGAAAGARNVISGNFLDGVRIEGSSAIGNAVQGNFIGTTASGSAALGNLGPAGVELRAPLNANNVIGGAVSGAGNVISGNTHGILIASNANTVQGNFIGTDVNGSGALPNSGDGVRLFLAFRNIIGGTTAEARNTISGNGGAGVSISGVLFPNGAAFASGNVIQGNYIGTDSIGANAVGNTTGVLAQDAATNNVIGGTSADAGNVISGNLGDGVVIRFGGGNRLEGNLIGTKANGVAPLPNTSNGVSLISNAKAFGNIIGGSEAGAGNVISANGGNGIFLLGATFGDYGHRVAGNFIGTDVTGTLVQEPGSNAPLGNVLDGIHIEDSARNAIGIEINQNTDEETIAGNLISGNRQNGIQIVSVSGDAGSNRVLGNLIGTDVNGASKLGNSFAGVLIFQAGGNTVGGGKAEARNLVSGNGGSGIVLFGDPSAGTASANVIQGNYLGTDSTGEIDLGNAGRGVDLTGATNTLVGGTKAALRNLISGNGMQGIDLHNGATGNIVQGNFIGTDVMGTAKLGNEFEGIVLENAPGNRIGGTVSGAGNVISGNGLAGVYLLDADAHDNIVRGNFIGTDLAAKKQIGNGGDGVLIKNAANNAIGGTPAGAGNRIRFNSGRGVVVFQNMPDLAKGDSIRHNSIAENAGQGIDLGNNGVTPNDPGDADTGPNERQNRPKIMSVVASPGSLTIRGRLKSMPNQTYSIDLFSNNAPHPVTEGQGRFFLGSIDVTTNANGAALFNITLPAPNAAKNVSATATDANGNTSEFSGTVAP